MSREGFKLENSIKNESINNKEKIIDFKMKKIVDDITRVFEEEKPEKISPRWMTKKLRYDYETLKKILPRENNKINYKPLVDLLPKHIEERWNIQEHRSNISLKDIVDDIVIVFEEEKPEKISPSWIAQKLRYDYYTLKKILPIENNKINYHLLVDLLPKHIAERWNIQEERISISLKDIVDDIVFIFEKEKPKKISLNWIAQKLRYDYETLKKILPRENNKINYQPLLDLLPKDIVEKWDNQEQRVNISIKEVADDITRVFEQEKPEKISPSWISQRLKADYSFLKDRLFRENNKINYQPLLDLLPKNVAEKWEPFLGLEDIIPKDSYSDSKETDIILSKNKDKMYLFLNNIDKGEKNQDREDIIKDMREIIMKGNTEALDRLIDYLVFTVEDWTINDPDNFKVWQYAQDKLRDVIKNCIYRHNPTKGNFLKYLYVTLKKRAIDIKIYSSGGGSNFKKRYVDGGVEYHENIDEEYY